MSRIHFVGAAALALTLGFAHTADAQEINYAAIRAQAGDNLHIEYRSPAGPSHFVCSVTTTECSAYGTSTPTIAPALIGATDYTRNPQGTMGIRHFTLGTLTYYILFDLTQSPPKSMGVLPFIPPISSIHFSADGQSVILLSPGAAQRYHIATRQMGPRVQLSQNELPMRTISPKGTYLAAYNYGVQGNRIWNLIDGTHFTVPSSVPNYVEFSEDERYAAFADHVEGFKSLHVFPLYKLPTLETTRLTTKPALVEDYIFVDNTLFYLANVSHPLTWSLFAHKDGETTVIDDEASYGDYMKRVDASSHTSRSRARIPTSACMIHAPKRPARSRLSPLRLRPIRSPARLSPLPIATARSSRPRTLKMQTLSIFGSTVVRNARQASATIPTSPTRCMTSCWSDLPRMARTCSSSTTPARGVRQGVH
jgi:hypothetical protein